MYEEIQSRLAARPFEPFVVVTVDGWSREVTDPRFCEADDDVVRLYRRKPDTSHGREVIATVAVRHVVRVTPADEDDGIPY